MFGQHPVFSVSDNQLSHSDIAVWIGYKYSGICFDLTGCKLFAVAFMTALKDSFQIQLSIIPPLPNDTVVLLSAV